MISTAASSFRWIGIVHVLVGWTMSLSLTAYGQGPLGALFPPDGSVVGWQQDGETAIATNETELAALINGAAPFYVDHGTEEAGFQDYTDSSTYLTLEIYRTDSAAEASLLYESIYVEAPLALDDCGDRARLLQDLPGVIVLEFIEDGYFIRLTFSGKSDEGRSTLFAFAADVTSRIGQSKTEQDR